MARLLLFYGSFLILLAVQRVSAADMTSVSSSQWKKQMKTELVNSMCKKDSFFSQCVSYEGSNCLSRVTSYYSQCETKMRLPSSVDLITDGTTLGRRLGACVGKQILKNNEQLQTVQCRNRNAWIK